MLSLSRPVDTSKAGFSPNTEAALKNPEQYFNTVENCYRIFGKGQEGNYKIQDADNRIRLFHQNSSAAPSCTRVPDYREVLLTDTDTPENQKTAYKLVMTNNHFNARKVANSIKDLMLQDSEQFIELISHMEIKHAADVMNHIVSDSHQTKNYELNDVLITLAKTQPNLFAQMLLNVNRAGTNEASYSTCFLQRLSSALPSEAIACQMNEILNCAKPEGKALLLRELCNYCLNTNKSADARNIMIEVLTTQLDALPAPERTRTLLTLKLLRPQLFTQLAQISAFDKYDMGSITPQEGDVDKIKENMQEFGFSLPTNTATEKPLAPVSELKDLKNLTELTLGFGENRRQQILSSIDSVLSRHITDKQQVSMLSKKILHKMQETGTELCFDSCVRQVLASRPEFKPETTKFDDIAAKINDAILKKNITKLSRSDAEKVVTRPISPTPPSTGQPKATKRPASASTGTVLTHGRVVPEGCTLYKAAPDGACLYRTIVAAKTKDPLWCKAYSNQQLLRSSSARTILFPFVQDAVIEGVKQCETLYSASYPQLEQLAQQLDLTMPELGEKIYQKCFAEGDFRLSNANGVISALNLTETEELKTALDDLICTIGEIIATNNGIKLIYPSTPQDKINSTLQQHGVALVWTKGEDGGHYDLMVNNRFFTNP